MNKKGAYSLWIGILSLLTLAGLAAWGFQLFNGLGVTGMDNVVSWGLYIIAFMFFVGLSAGGLIVSSSATVFNIPSFKAAAKPAVILSTVCILAAGAFIFVDLGGVGRVFNLLLHPQFNSPLMWDVVVISLYLVLNIAYLYFMTRREPAAGKLRLLSGIALPLAILVHSVTAWIFGLQIARAGWHSALMAPLFVASALDSGLALLIVALLALKKFTAYKVDNKLISSLAGLLVICVAVDAFFVFSELLTMLYPGEESSALLLREMTSGAMAPFFWGEIILGFLIPFVVLIFSRNRANTGLVLFSSLFVIMGVFCKRVWLLLTSFIFPRVAGGPGVTSGRFSAGTDTVHMPDFWVLNGSYAPTLIEYTIMIGIIAMAALIFTGLARTFLLRESSSNHLERSGSNHISALDGALPAEH